MKGHDARPPIVVSELEFSEFFLPDHDTALAVRVRLQPSLISRVLGSHESVLSKAAAQTTSPTRSIFLTFGLDLPTPVFAGKPCLKPKRGMVLSD